MANSSERYDDISDDVREHFMEVYNRKSFPIMIGFQYIHDAKLKQVIKIQKLSEQYQFIIKKEILVTVNEDLFDKLDEESQNILIEQELDKIAINPESGKISMNKPDLMTFSPIMNKYGVDAVLRANQVEQLANEQHQDALS